MPSEIELALELQRMDRILRELEIEIRSLPKRVAQFEQQVNAAKLHAEGAEASRESNRLEIQRVERANDEQNAKLARLKKQLMDATTQNQVTAFQHEIEWAEREIAKNDGILADLRAKGEELGSKAVEARAAHEQLAGTLEEQKASAIALSEQDRKKGVKIFRERNALHATFPQKLREIYDRLRKSHKDGIVVAECTEAMCTGCLMTVRPALMQQIRTERDKMFFCESCRRIMHYNPTRVVDA